MHKYTKIETLYTRDTQGTKQLVEGTFRSPAVEFLKDMEWYGTEKIDGTNIGIVWDGHNITFQGRTERAQISADLVTKLTELFLNDATEELFEQVFGEKPVILFGEGYGAKIQNGGGNYIPDGVSFILFDVYMPESNTWLRRDAIEDIGKTFGLDVVPIVYRGNLAGAVEFVKTNPDSTIGTAKMEGIVCKPVYELLDRNGDRIIVKIKWCDFKDLVTT